MFGWLLQVIELELTTGIPMLYTIKDSKFHRRGSPVGPTVAGVYALTKVSRKLIHSFCETTHFCLLPVQIFT